MTLGDPVNPCKLNLQMHPADQTVGCPIGLAGRLCCSSGKCEQFVEKFVLEEM